MVSRSVLTLSLVLAGACSDHTPTEPANPPPSPSGGLLSTGGAPSAGGEMMETGGALGSGGVLDSGGVSSGGGASTSGGVPSSGGMASTGGRASGGVTGSGGVSASGGLGGPPAPDAVVALSFEDDLQDVSGNQNHATAPAAVSYTAGPNGGRAVSLDGLEDFVQLPPTVANHSALTVAAWVYWRGGASWQRIFDFGNGESENMFLTPSSGDGTLRFAIKNGGAEQVLDAPVLGTDLWHHLVITLGAAGGALYLDGVQITASETITLRPDAFSPALNYIGRSQYPDPLFYGAIDDFRVYSYALTEAEVNTLAAGN